MRPNHLLLSLTLAALLPSQAQAEVKSYDLDVFTVLNTTTLTVTGDSMGANDFIGSVTISDASNASPTLETYEILIESVSTVHTDVFGGLNSFIYTRQLSTTSPLAGQTGTGDTEGFVKWNPLSSWTALGGRWCKSSNEIGNPVGGTICGVLGRGFENTQAVTVPSESYDFALWTFDAQGDFSSAGYLWIITSNGSSNNDYFNRGKLRINVPALSLVGFGVMGAAMLFLGVRALRSRKQ